MAKKTYLYNCRDTVEKYVAMKTTFIFVSLFLVLSFCLYLKETTAANITIFLFCLFFDVLLGFYLKALKKKCRRW